MKIYWACYLCLINRLDVVLLQQVENVFADLSVVEVSVHLGIFSLNQDASQSTIGVSLSFMLLVEGDDHLNNV